MTAKLPPPIEPEYKKWPLEKLQGEYFRLKLKHLSLKMQVGDLESRERVFTEFLQAFKALQKELEKDD